MSGSAAQRVALAKAIVFGISNLHFGPEVGIGPAKSDAPVIDLWMNGVRVMAEDLRILAEKDRASRGTSGGLTRPTQRNRAKIRGRRHHLAALSE